MTTTSFMFSELTLNGQNFISTPIAALLIGVIITGLMLLGYVLYDDMLERKLRFYKSYIENTQQLQRFHEWKKQRSL